MLVTFDSILHKKCTNDSYISNYFNDGMKKEISINESTFIIKQQDN